MSKVKLFNKEIGSYGNAVITYRRRPLTWRLFTLTHSDTDGGPVLRELSSWRTISGVCVNTRWGHVLFQFRGFQDLTKG